MIMALIIRQNRKRLRLVILLSTAVYFMMYKTHTTTKGYYFHNINAGDTPGVHQDLPNWAKINYRAQQDIISNAINNSKQHLDTSNLLKKSLAPTTGDHLPTTLVTEDLYFSAQLSNDLTDIVHDIVDILQTPKVSCKKLVDMGGHLDCEGCTRDCNNNGNCTRCVKDGNKAVCFDKNVAPVPGKCLVYSFGIGNDFSFDNAIAGFGCQVYSFDFSMTNWTHKYYAPNQHFLSLGLSHKNQRRVNFAYELEGQQHVLTTSMLTLKSILKVLDALDTDISYLKMDIENAEWDVLTQVLTFAPSVLSRVKQLSLEVHLEDILKLDRELEVALPRVERISRVLKGLQEVGFQLTHRWKNPKTDVRVTFGARSFPLYQEVLFIRR